MSILIFIIGLLFGSFFLVVGTRLPQKEDIIFSRSHCDECHHPLKWYNLIPLFSYILQKGKCSYCHKKISILNFIVELATGILFLAGYLLYGLSYEFYLYLIVISLMLVIFISDFLYMIILDSALVVASILIIILKFIYLGYISTFMSIFYGIILFLIMYFVQYLGTKIFKKEALGGGDVKLAFVIGLVLDINLGLIALLLSTFLALPYSIASLYLTKNHEVPYGPFLVGALTIVYLFMDKFSALLTFIFG